MLAEVEFTEDTQGVIFAQGSRFGGHSLLVTGGKLSYVNDFLGIPPEQRIVGNAPTSECTSSGWSSRRTAATP